MAPSSEEIVIPRLVLARIIEAEWPARDANIQGWGDRRDFVILQMWLVHGWTLDEIGAQFGFGRSRAQQLKNQALARLYNNARKLGVTSYADCLA